jgi:hypothetical protein
MTILPIYFIIGFLSIIFILYILYPEPVIYTKYPDIRKDVSQSYKDDNGVCYKYHRREITM